ncbi:hypothetical protein A2U01_0042558, partial [Trifolium medium]|nr:hypothetical protein [Trifolium medium]
PHRNNTENQPPWGFSPQILTKHHHKERKPKPNTSEKQNGGELKPPHEPHNTITRRADENTKTVPEETNETQRTETETDDAKKQKTEDGRNKQTMQRNSDEGKPAKTRIASPRRKNAGKLPVVTRYHDRTTNQRWLHLD